MEIKKLLKVKYFRRLVILICVLNFATCTSDKMVDLNKYANTLATANIKLRGKLLLNEYQNDLTSLTFEKYVVLLKQNETPSSEGLEKLVKKSDNHLFIAKENTFHIVLYSKKLHAIVYDNANTFGVDSIKLLNKNEIVPDLQSFIRNLK